MQFDEYEEVWKETAIYPGAGSGEYSALIYTALGLGNEAGEFQGKLKKLYRDGMWDRQEALQELGDVLWYIAAAANELGSSLNVVATMNMIKLRKRKAAGTLHGSGDTR